MPYCEASDVRLVVETSLSDQEIETLVGMSDAEIDGRLGAQSPADTLVKKLSTLLTAHAIKTRQPQTQAIGEYREDSGDVLEVWEREIEGIYRLKGGVRVSASGYQRIKEEERYPRG
ncbi:MAG: hypothetical protein PVJ38_02545 [Candidatus Bathyarchaeota archaeon]|jgi:hypothetical protein